MKAKELNPKQLGQKEDWLGNNAAFECPVCDKVYLVSGFVQHERPCPNCGQSRGRVTGSIGKGGKAIITWDNFVLGRKYTRKEISLILGGSEIDYLPTEKGRVVCGCFTLDHNPNAPDIIIPATGKVIERTAKIFCVQENPVPVFIKRKPKEWEYVGHYKVEKFSTDPKEITKHHNGSITPLKDVTRVIYLKRH